MSQFHNGQNIYVESIHLRVRDISKSLQFYQDVLKMKVYEQSETEALLGSEKFGFLKLQAGAFEKRKRSAGLYHFALLFQTKEELGAVLKNIISKGYKLQGASDHDVSEAIYLQDIDGHGIELYIDKAASLWKWNKEEVYMDTKALDLEKLLEVAQPNHSVLSEHVMLGHVHLSVLDTRKSRAFYELLGFDTVLDLSHAVFMSHNKYHHHLAVNTWGMLGGTIHRQDDIDIEEMVIHYPTKQNLDNVLQKLVNNQYTYVIKNEEILVADPNEIPIRLVVNQEMDS